MFKKLITALIVVALLSLSVAASATVTIGIYGQTTWGNKRITYGYISFGSTTYSTGYTINPVDVRLNNIEAIYFTPLLTVAGGRHYAYNTTDNVLRVYQSSASNTHTFTATAITADSLNVMDDNSAASNGKLVIVCSSDGLTGWFENLGGDSTTAGAAKYFASDSSTASMVADTVWTGHHYLNATLVYGDTLYFDDDGATEDRRLYYSGTNIKSTNNLYVPFSCGRSIVVSYLARADTIGVPVYFDYDASAVDERWLAVNAGNADSGFDADDDRYAGISPKPTGTLSTAAAAAGTELGASDTPSDVIYFLAVGN